MRFRVKATAKTTVPVNGCAKKAGDTFTSNRHMDKIHPGVVEKLPDPTPKKTAPAPKKG